MRRKNKLNKENMEEFIEQMLELGAMEDRAETHTERMLVIEEARKLYKEHIENL